MWKPSWRPGARHRLACPPAPGGILDRLVTIFFADSSMKSRGPNYYAMCGLVSATRLGRRPRFTTLRKVDVGDHFYTGAPTSSRP
jgi:hypothetical protein